MTDQSPLLEGLKVLDLGRIYQGPWCGNLLALGGATVIKIEEPSGLEGIENIDTLEK